jgi:hypothetical protein
MTRMYWDKHGIEGISIRIGSASERPTEFRHLSTRLGHDDLVQLLMCCIEGPEVGYLAVWGVSNNTRSYYDTSAVERIGWSGAGQHRPETSKPSAQRPGEQERGKRLSREERERASFLRQCLGLEVGVRRSVAQIGEQLPAHDRKNARMGELVSKIASSFVAEGLAELAPGPRGGAGWSLTQKGKDLIDRADVAVSVQDASMMGSRNP